ncbi:PREDICTED: zinc finger CCCH domain-containing protein 53-like isoform X1 [Lupinus angustifolius]|uniref:zinc finger CCCH domain-containing protein 53-like isoform X1 n=1 Tax=Lupinus angustifolius TaxID=3871 RepID=UPI00092E351B|nr:PREDICTED: zinc finger CCCH domain-containing protein 53-like isoform X1 [Lupinus angustifolius]XP_019450853.1 PREDICTED: zinc finger CCCH domain-containing protein 53-like isoform X1 [Lupinus angustifolius]
MDGYEATRTVFSRIQNLDPENASKIMGMLLIQDHGEKEMIRLAFGPEALVHSVIVKARKDLGLRSNSPPSPPTPPSSSSSASSPFLSRQSSITSASRLGGIKLPPALTIPNSTSSNSPSWTTMSDLNNPDELIMSPNNPNSLLSSSLPFYHHANGGVSDPIDESQLQDQLSFLNDGSPHKNQDLFYPHHSDLSSSPTGGAADPNLFPSYGWGGSLHRRSCSVNDACLGSEDPNSGFGWKPCLYFARGYCKNGTTCRFLHGGGGTLGDADAAMVGSPSKIEMMDELLRSKTAQQQRLAAASQLMASSFPYSPKGMNFLLQHQQNDSPRGAVAALMMNEELHKFGRSRLERNDFSLNSTGIVNPASRQIYLTFPADSTFREEDVSNYFSIYGPVQDVRIPYQQKRMFGFVTFVYPETVKLILSKGNPHFVCDARVLVKPYKEKGKVPDKYRKQQQQLDRGDFSPCGTPTGLDARDQFDLQLGGRMFYNTQDMLWRRKLEEQADFQQALELQSRRLMGLQLLDFKKQHHRALSTGSPIPSPTHSPSMFNQNIVFPPFHSSSETPQDNGSSSAPASSTVSVNTFIGKEVVGNGENGYNDGNGKSSSHEECDLHECLEHNLPDSPFASPTKAAAGNDYMAAFSNGPNEAIHSDALAASANSKFGTSTLLPSPSALDMASFKSFNCQIPRFSSGPGTIGMVSGTGGPIGI